jgi:serine/threonine-protein kinase
MPVMRASQSTAMIIVAAIAVVGIAALAATWWLWPRAETTVAAAKPTAPGQPARDAPRTIAPSPEYATPQANAASASPRSAVAAAPTDTPATPGTLVISAVGLADPSDPRYANDKSLVQTDARADSKQQLVAKALALLLDRDSMATNYELLQSRVVAKSGDYITTVMREGEPQLGKDGLMWVTTQAVVNVKAVQQSLNRMSRDERVELIRAHGDPRIALRITMRDADRPDVPSQPSPLAENILKERIKSFGFRTWSDDGNASTNADFLVVGEASLRRFSTRLAASGLVVTKYGLSSWTVKCTNRVTGEEVYFNTALPKGAGTWASEEEALRAIGNGIADQFNRNLFLQHVNVSSRKIALVLSGMPDAASEELLARELVGLPSVISVDVGPQAKPRVYDVQVALPVSGDAIASEVIAPLNAKAGAGCFALGAIDGDRVAIALHPRCAEGLRARLETNPPAGLYGAPAARQKAVIKNPEMLRRLAV